MKMIGSVVQFDAPSGVGTVRNEGGGIETTVFAADLTRAGIAPRVGARFAYVIGTTPSSGITQATQIERLG